MVPDLVPRSERRRARGAAHLGHHSAMGRPQVRTGAAFPVMPEVRPLPPLARATVRITWGGRGRSDGRSDGLIPSVFFSSCTCTCRPFPGKHL